jgi:hypothetical protein
MISKEERERQNTITELTRMDTQWYRLYALSYNNLVVNNDKPKLSVHEPWGYRSKLKKEFYNTLDINQLRTYYKLKKHAHGLLE